jgi:cell wall-associated NlpC family hydrolase
VVNVDLHIEHRKAAASLRNAIVEQAKKWIGTPYLFGGNSPSGIDCSHFVYQAVNDARKACAPDSLEPQLLEYRSTGTIEASHLWLPTKDLDKGDLVLWDGHAGIVLDPGLQTFIGAQSSTGVAVASYASGYWQKRAGMRFLRFYYLW